MTAATSKRLRLSKGSSKMIGVNMFSIEDALTARACEPIAMSRLGRPSHVLWTMLCVSCLRCVPRFSGLKPYACYTSISMTTSEMAP